MPLRGGRCRPRSIIRVLSSMSACSTSIRPLPTCLPEPISGGQRPSNGQDAPASAVAGLSRPSCMPEPRARAWHMSWMARSKANRGAMSRMSLEYTSPTTCRRPVSTSERDCTRAVSLPLSMPMVENSRWASSAIRWTASTGSSSTISAFVISGRSRPRW